MSDQDTGKKDMVPPKVVPPSAGEGAPSASLRPITVKLKPVTAMAPAPAPDTDESPTLATAPAPVPSATSRIPLQDAVGATPAAPAAPAAPIRPVTVKLRPLAAPGTPPRMGSTQSIAKMEVPVAKPETEGAAEAISPLQPRPAPVPGSDPLPPGPKPISPAQQQAAKSKTSRISLEDAIGSTGESKPAAAPKTIRLKRPSDLTPPVAAKGETSVVRKTSRIPDVSLGVDGAGATVTQKKTLKIRRPGADSPAPAGADGDGAIPDGVKMTPLSPVDMGDFDESSQGLTIAAIIAAVAALIVIFLTTWFLAAHAIGSVAGKNYMAFVQGPDLPCPGRIVQ